MANPAPTLPQHVWTGWLEDFRQWVRPTTDACEESIYAAGLLALSCAIGRTCSINYAGALYSNLYVTIVGPTSVARKTTVLRRARSVLQRAFDLEYLRWARSVGSAEGLLERFCRETENGSNGHKQLIFAPIPGQRLVLDESEFTGLFVKMSRPATANLLEVFLTLYDGEDYKPHTRSRPMEVQQPFFSILSATTPTMLEKRIDDIHLTSGLLPRFAFFQTTPRDPMPYPDPADPDGLDHLGKGLQRLALFAKSLNRSLELTADAHTSWIPIYTVFQEQQRAAEGLSADLLSRNTALAMKIALIYALMREHTSVDADDLHAGSAVAAYCSDVALQLSISSLDTTQDGRLAERILKAMPDGEWVLGSQIFQAVGGKVGGGRFHQALDGLVQEGIIDKKIITVRGRQRPMYRRVKL